MNLHEKKNKAKGKKSFSHFRKRESGAFLIIQGNSLSCRKTQTGFEWLELVRDNSLGTLCLYNLGHSEQLTGQ